MNNRTLLILLNGSSKTFSQHFSTGFSPIKLTYKDDWTIIHHKCTKGNSVKSAFRHFYTQNLDPAFFFFARLQHFGHLFYSNAISSLLVVVFIRFAIKKLYLLK